MSSCILSRSERFYEIILSLDSQHKDMHFVVNVVPEIETKNFATIVCRKLENSRLQAKAFYDGYFPSSLVQKGFASNTYHFRVTSIEDARDETNLPHIQENFACLSVMV